MDNKNLFILMVYTMTPLFEANGSGRTTGYLLVDNPLQDAHLASPLMTPLATRSPSVLSSQGDFEIVEMGEDEDIAFVPSLQQPSQIFTDTASSVSWSSSAPLEPSPLLLRRVSVVEEEPVRTPTPLIREKRLSDPLAPASLGAFFPQGREKEYLAPAPVPEGGRSPLPSEKGAAHNGEERPWDPPSFSGEDTLLGSNQAAFLGSGTAAGELIGAPSVEKEKQDRSSPQKGGEKEQDAPAIRREDPLLNRESPSVVPQQDPLVASERTWAVDLLTNQLVRYHRGAVVESLPPTSYRFEHDNFHKTVTVTAVFDQSGELLEGKKEITAYTCHKTLTKLHQLVFEGGQVTGLFSADILHVCGCAACLQTTPQEVRETRAADISVPLTLLKTEYIPFTQRKGEAPKMARKSVLQLSNGQRLAFVDEDHLFPLQLEQKGWIHQDKSHLSIPWGEGYIVDGGKKISLGLHQHDSVAHKSQSQLMFPEGYKVHLGGGHIKNPEARVTTYTRPDDTQYRMASPTGRYRLETPEWRHQDALHVSSLYGVSFLYTLQGQAMERLPDTLLETRTHTASKSLSSSGFPGGALGGGLRGGGAERITYTRPDGSTYEEKA